MVWGQLWQLLHENYLLFQYALAKQGSSFDTFPSLYSNPMLEWFCEIRPWLQMHIATCHGLKGLALASSILDIEIWGFYCRLMLWCYSCAGICLILSHNYCSCWCQLGRSTRAARGEPRPGEKRSSYLQMSASSIHHARSNLCSHIEYTISNSFIHHARKYTISNSCSHNNSTRLFSVKSL
jgi:hypothetical protein